MRLGPESLIIAITTYYGTDRTSKQQPSLGKQPAHIYIYTYLSFFAFFVPVRTFYCLSLFFSGASDMEMFLVLLVGLYKVRDGAPQLAGPVPLRTGTGVYSFLFCMCVLPSRRFFAWFWLSQVTVY